MWRKILKSFWFLEWTKQGLSSAISFNVESRIDLCESLLFDSCIGCRQSVSNATLCTPGWLAKTIECHASLSGGFISMSCTFIRAPCHQNCTFCMKRREKRSSFTMAPRRCFPHAVKCDEIPTEGQIVSPSCMWSNHFAAIKCFALPWKQ